MIPGDEKKQIAAYLKSLAATATPEAFTAAALPLVRRDSYASFSGKVYASAMKAANKAQKANLEAEVARQRIKTGRTSRRSERILPCN